MDGHERPDVLQARKDYAMKYRNWRSKCVRFNDDSEELEELPSADAEYVLCSLDQKAHHSNDVVQRLDSFFLTRGSIIMSETIRFSPLVVFCFYS